MYLVKISPSAFLSLVSLWWDPAGDCQVWEGAVEEMNMT